MKKNLLTLMLILTLPFLGMSQSLNVIGQVTGPNGPIADVDVSVYNSPTAITPGEILETTQTDATGTFYFELNSMQLTDIIALSTAACPENESYIFSQPNGPSDTAYVALYCGEDTTLTGFEALYIGAAPLNNTGSEWYFTSSVFGEVESYLWSIEGQSYSTPDVTHAFSQTGAQEVTLTTQMASGNELSASTWVYVQDSLLCEAMFFPMADSTSEEGVVFVNASFGYNLEYLWDFGDGSTSTDPYPTFTFTDSLEYEVCLTVSSATCEDTFCMTVSQELIEEWYDVIINGIIAETGGTVKDHDYRTYTDAKSNGFEFRVVPLLNGALSTSDSDLAIDLGLFPNPSQGSFSLNLSTEYPETGLINVYDISGRSVHQEVGILSQGKNVFTLDLNELPDGVYVISFSGQMNVGAQKLVIRR